MVFWNGIRTYMEGGVSVTGSVFDRVVYFMLLPGVDAERHGRDSAAVSSAAKMCEGYRPLLRGTHMTILCNRIIQN